MGLFTLANARKNEPWNENWTQTDGFNQNSTAKSTDPLTSTASVEPAEKLNTDSDPK